LGNVAGTHLPVVGCTDTVEVLGIPLSTEAVSRALRPLSLHTLPEYCALYVGGHPDGTRVVLGFFVPLTDARRAELTAHIRAVLPTT
jgi:hypothetical protein